MRFIHDAVIKLNEFLETRAGHILIGSVVIVNAILLGAMTFKSMPHDIMHAIHTLDEVILGIYVTELVVKIYSTGFRFFKGKWNLFDFSIVVLSFVHHQDFFLILRSVRVLHLMTMLDASPRMRHILHGLGKSIPGVLNVVGILMMFFYIYAVMGVFLFQDVNVPGFEHIGASMRTMFQVLTGDDWAKIMDTAELGMRYAPIYFISFYIIVVFVILNLFIGVVVRSMEAAEEEIYSSDDDDGEPDLKGQVTRLEEKLEAIHAILRNKPFGIK